MKVINILRKLNLSVIWHCLHRNAIYEFLFTHLQHKNKKKTFEEINFLFTLACPLLQSRILINPILIDFGKPSDCSYLKIESAANFIRFAPKKRGVSKESNLFDGRRFFYGNKLREKVRRNFHGSAYRNCFLVTDVSRVTNPITHRRLPWPALRFATAAALCLSMNFQQLNPDNLIRELDSDF